MVSFFSVQKLIDEYRKNHPRETRKYRFPVSGTYLSEEATDRLVAKDIEALFRVVAEIECKDRFFEASIQDIQIALHFYSFDTRFCRYIAFNRKTGTPLIIKETKSKNRKLAMEFGFERYHRLLEILFKAPTIVKTMYHNLSMQDLMKIDGNTWSDYVLPEKNSYASCVVKSVGDSRDGTIAEMQSKNKYVALYQQKKYTVIDEIFSDCVVDLLSDDGSNFRVDLRDVTDICKKDFFIKVKENRFFVLMSGENSVLIDGNYPGDLISLGFESVGRPGEAYEIDVSRIDAIECREQSVYDGIVGTLKRDWGYAEA